MAVLTPRTVDEVVAALVDAPDSDLLGGGTDLMVEVNFGHRRPRQVIALDRVRELGDIEIIGDRLRIGAGVTYRRMCGEPFTSLAPVIAQAARTVGSPQIRNVGTLGGNLATASPAGDLLPPLVALDAVIELAGTGGRRRVAISDFLIGPKRTDRRPDEVVVAAEVPILNGAQEYLKVGTRNAMVISVAGVALVVDRAGGAVACALGSVGPTILRCSEAEAAIAARVDWSMMSVPADAVAQFADLVGRAARPIDDHRSTAAYRRHAVMVCARRAAERVLVVEDAS